jgi:hypothetical protein
MRPSTSSEAGRIGGLRNASAKRESASRVMNDRRRLRRLLSLEAARLMDESGFRDPQLALRKAVARLAPARPSGLIRRTSRRHWGTPPHVPSRGL